METRSKKLEREKRVKSGEIYLEVLKHLFNKNEKIKWVCTLEKQQNGEILYEQDCNYNIWNLKQDIAYCFETTNYKIFFEMPRFKMGEWYYSDNIIPIITSYCVIVDKNGTVVKKVPDMNIQHKFATNLWLDCKNNLKEFVGKKMFPIASYTPCPIYGIEPTKPIPQINVSNEYVEKIYAYKEGF